jgi:FAD/FMN-containing dehydrogenase
MLSELHRRQGRYALETMCIGVGLEKKPYLHFVRDDAEIQLMRTIKMAMDPRGILNPGKIF